MALRVLVVDDSNIARKVLIKELNANLQAEIQQAKNGIEGLTLIQTFKPHVTFLDLTMPEMDGYTLLETIFGVDHRSCIIVVSADIQPKAAQRVQALGATAFLKKNVSWGEIAPVLREQGIL